MQQISDTTCEHSFYLALLCNCLPFVCHQLLQNNQPRPPAFAFIEYGKCGLQCCLLRVMDI
jgi:hypothetical protein